MRKLSNRVLRLTHSARTRLIALVLCAVVPMMVLIWVNAVLERQRALDVGEQRVLELAKVAAEQQNDIVQEAENLLRVLARVPAVINVSSERCHKLLMTIADDHPRIVTIWVSNQAGANVCDSRDELPIHNVSDRLYFRELMSKEPPDFFLSEVLIGRRLGIPTIVAAVPLGERGANGLPNGIVAASLSLDWSGQRAEHVPSADAHTVVVFDARDGTVVASSSGDTRAVGRKFPDHPLIRAFRGAPGGGVIRAIDFSGVPQVFGFMALPATNGHLAVAVGLTEEGVLGGANRHFVFSLGLALGVACITLLLALLAARSWLLRPGAVIVAVVRAFGMGDMGKRIAMKAITLNEMKQLATTFNAMADAIEEQDQKLVSTQQALEQAITQLDRLAHEDALTGLANRRQFDKGLDFEWHRAHRACEPLGVLMIDLDRFKAYNDTFGHQAGDACLVTVAKAVRSALRRPTDLAARYGGEEIVVVLPNTDRRGATLVGERVAAAVRALHIPHPTNPGQIVTISVGAASCLPANGKVQAQDLLSDADKALYEAKEKGRDQVRFAADQGACQ